MVPSLDRYSRSLQDLINMVAELRTREIGFTSLHENLDTTTPGGRLVFHVFAALTEFIRELIVQGTRKGLAAARDLLPGPGRSITSIAELLGVSPGTQAISLRIRTVRAAAAMRRSQPHPSHQSRICASVVRKTSFRQPSG